MSTMAKQSTSVISAIKSLFASGIDVENQEDIKFSKELDDVLKALSVREKGAEEPINVANSSKKSGFGKKINPNTEKAMRAMHKEVKQNSNEDRDRERE